MNSAARMQLIDGTTPVVSSDAMRKVMTMAEKVATHDAAVLIVGETGSGKELVARAVHQHSLRCGKPFIDVNCAALPEHLVESELFGYEKGAFSGADATKPGLFELADQGTLFLDEIGELDAKVQAKLLRVLDGIPYYRLGGHRKVAIQVRIIAATNRDLEQEVHAGKFRSDLYHRLTQFQLRVPPLRERPDDIAALAEHFVREHDASLQLTSEALEILQRYSWPGNVRELRNTIFRAAMQIKAGAKEIRAADLPAVICGIPENAGKAGFSGNLEDMEKRMIQEALAAHGQSQQKAAQQLGISTRTLRRKLEKYKKEAGRAGTAPAATGRAEQQRYFRVTLEMPVLLTVDGKQVECQSVNLSSGGISVHCPITLAHGAAVEIAFTIPDSEVTIETKAKLAWTSPGGLVGLSFSALHPAMERQLEDWLLQRARQEGWTPAKK
ncbi:MAG TPA: sigma 54-interacting transcriptional regulator [Terriglobales bacterium]|nr:sigma 54-interacting transcriptional regulator [Terriglobales bacterium]